MSKYDTRINVFLIFLVTSYSYVKSAKCPWNDDTLSKWSSLNTWPSGQLPQDEDSVVIENRVLLDIQPPTLASIVIEKDGALIWGNVDGIQLNTTYILVLGEFVIGTEKCSFMKTANIKLYGIKDSVENVTDFGQKFIGVESGGLLDIHGRPKNSWTKLAHTIPAAHRMGCGFLYYHKNSTHIHEDKSGLHLLVWSSDASEQDFKVYNSKNYDDLKPYLDTLDEGTVIAGSVKVTLNKPSHNFLEDLRSLGTSIQSLRKNQKYSFIAIKGEPESTVEEFGTSAIRLFHNATQLMFQAQSDKDDVDFQVMVEELAQPKITLQEDVSSWQIGDQVIITSTDFDWRQVESKRIIECPDCKGNQIKLDTPFKYMHFGEVTHNVDERAEVALISRNIKIWGELEDECYFQKGDEYAQYLCKHFDRDLFGGHVMAVEGATIRLEGIEFFQMGQQHFVSRYPIHFHQMHDAPKSYASYNSIHDSFSRCITLHATNHVQLRDNVCYLHIGHGYFLEDSVEEHNVLHRNLAVGALPGTQMLSDRKRSMCPFKETVACGYVSSFWITHPNNILTDNVAAGADENGFHYVFADAPIGTSRYLPRVVDSVKKYSLQYFPLKGFSGNIAHSNQRAGVFFDGRISTGEKKSPKDDTYYPENAILPVAPRYDPRDPPTEDGKKVLTYMSRLTMFKNRKFNAWIKGGNIRMINSSFADSQSNFAGGTIAGKMTSSGVMDSVFIGYSDNLGEPELFKEKDGKGFRCHQFNHSIAKSPYKIVYGVGIYQGPIIVKNCFFDKFYDYYWAPDWKSKYGKTPYRNGVAISFDEDSIYPTKPWSKTSGLKFGYCDNVNNQHWLFRGSEDTYGWVENDASRLYTFLDEDGSLTGRANTQLVIDRPFYVGPECVSHKDWNMAACPYKYVQLEFLGKDGVLGSDKKKKNPITVTRDDVAKDSISLEGTQQNNYLLLTYKSYLVRFNPKLGPVPKYFDIRASNVEKGDVVRVGLCLPKDSEFTFKSDYPKINEDKPPILTQSLKELDADNSGRAFYWNKKIGILYFKLVSNETRQNETETCANGKCIRYKIYRKGSVQPVTCSNFRNPPIEDNSPTPSKPPPEKKCKGPDSSRGLGSTPDNVLAAPPFRIKCPPSHLNNYAKVTESEKVNGGGKRKRSSEDQCEK